VILEGLDLENWMPFRGKHSLALGPKVYGVSARLEGNAERSNWQGKTALVEAIRFSLYGEHRFSLEDAWITRGESTGQVAVLFDDGFSVIRERKRGKRTSLEASPKSLRRGPHVAKDDAAQGLIVQRTGLSLEDFRATVYFGQRDAARLVNVRSAERTEVVESWLRLEPLMSAEDKVVANLGVLETRLDGWRQDLVAFRTQLEQELAGKTLEQLRAQRRHRAEFVEMNKKSLADLQKEREQVREVERVRDRLLAYKRLKAALEDLERRVATVDIDAAKAKLQAAIEHKEMQAKAHTLTRKEADDRRVAARGEFDGKCPVAGIQCPSRDEINKDQKTNLRRYEEAAAAASEEAKRLRRAEDDERMAREELDEATRLHSDLARARANEAKEREEVAALRAPIVDEGHIAHAATLLEQENQSLVREVAGLDERILRVERAQAGIAATERDIAQCEPKAATLRDAVHILGRQGARRRIAEPFLGELEAGANEALAECGVDLRVRVLWEHEGKDLARACAACGHPFPESARVKECSRCGEARGKNVVNRLEFEFSDRSAAAEDLAGVVLQLSAAAWLRRARGSALEFAVLDEPMAHCDRANRRAMAHALTQMLCGRFGFRQAFVVTHTPEASAFPGTILVTGHGTYSSVEVVS